MNGYDEQEAIDNPPRGDGTVSVLDYADGQAKAFRAGQQSAAAPGIDLPGWAFERPSGADVIVISAPNGKTWIAEPDDRLHMLAAAVIDASPKGGSDVLDALRAADGLAACCMAVDGYSRREIEELARATAPRFTAAIKNMQATSAEVGS